MDEDEDGFLKCEHCCLSFTGVEPYQQHLLGKSHKKREKFAGFLKIKDEKFEDNESAVANEIDNVKFTCTECNRKFSDPITYSQHLHSKPHHKQVRRNELTKKIREESSDETINFSTEHGTTHPALAPPFATCETCHKAFYGPEAYHQHLESSKHQQSFQKDTILQHLETEILKRTTAEDGESQDKTIFSHVTTSKLLALQASLSDEPSAHGEDSDYSCGDCDKSFSGLMPYIQHILSPVHKKQLNKLQALEAIKKHKEASNEGDDESPESITSLESVLTCEVCSVPFSGPESLQSHLKSKKHLKRLRWQKLVKSLAARGHSPLESSHGTQHTRDTPDNQQLHEELPKMQLEEGSEDVVPDSGQPTDAISEDSCAEEGKDASKPILKEEGIQTDEKHSSVKKITHALKAGLKEL